MKHLYIPSAKVLRNGRLLLQSTPNGRALVLADGSDTMARFQDGPKLSHWGFDLTWQVSWGSQGTLMWDFLLRSYDVHAHVFLSLKSSSHHVNAAPLLQLNRGCLAWVFEHHKGTDKKQSPEAWDAKVSISKREIHATKIWALLQARHHLIVKHPT